MRARARGLDEVQPVAARPARVLRGHDLHDLAALELVVERHHAVVDLGADVQRQAHGRCGVGLFHRVDEFGAGLGGRGVFFKRLQVALGVADVGGVQRATDILKAIAMGASVVAIGRLTGWGLAADGKDGLVRVLEILEHEMISAMGLLGITSVDQLGPEYVRDAPPVTPSHEMSAWVNMPGGRLL